MKKLLIPLFCLLFLGCGNFSKSNTSEDIDDSTKVVADTAINAHMRFKIDEPGSVGETLKYCDSLFNAIDDGMAGRDSEANADRRCAKFKRLIDANMESMTDEDKAVIKRYSTSLLDKVTENQMNRTQ